MALIKCPECGAQASDQAEKCIHCGFPLEKYLNTAILSVKRSYGLGLGEKVWCFLEEKTENNYQWHAADDIRIGLGEGEEMEIKIKAGKSRTFKIRIQNSAKIYAETILFAHARHHYYIRYIHHAGIIDVDDKSI